MIIMDMDEVPVIATDMVWIVMDTDVATIMMVTIPVEDTQTR